MFGWGPNNLLIPIEGKHLFVKAFALAHGPGFAVDLQLLTALALPDGTDEPTLPGRLHQTVHDDGDVKTQTVWLCGS